MNIDKLLTYKLTLISNIIDKKQIETIKVSFYKWKQNSTIQEYKEGLDNEVFINFLLFKIDSLIDEHNEITNLYTKFRKKYSKAVDEKEKDEIVIDFGINLTSFEQNLYGDKEALNRWMGDDAVDERFDKILVSIKRVMIFIIKRVGVIFKYNCNNLKDKSIVLSYWKNLNIMNHFDPLIDIQTDVHILNSLLDTTAVCLSCIDTKNLKEELLKEQYERFIYRLSLEINQDVWIQSSSLKVLFYLSKDFFIDAAKKRLTNYIDGDDIFVRNKILEIISQNNIDDELFNLVKIATKDRSEFVRQGVFKTLDKIDTNNSLNTIKTMLLAEKKDCVSAYGFDCLKNKKPSIDIYSNLIIKFLDTSKSVYITRYILDNIYNYIKLIKKGDFNILLEIIENIITTHKEIKLRRYAGEYLILIKAFFIVNSNKTLKQLQEDLIKLRSGKTLNIPKNYIQIDGFDTILTSLALNNHPLELIKTIFGYKIYKGDRINSKLWRFIYETKHTSPDKREAHDHTLAREFKGDKIYPTNKLSEVTPTKVPGEPVHQSYDGGWLNYLPLVGHIEYAIKKSIFKTKIVEIYTSQGCTKIEVKGNIFTKIKLYFWSIFNFDKIALKRSDTVQKNIETKSYKNYLKDKNIEISFNTNSKKDDSIIQFFSIAFIFSPLEYYDLLEDYFVSAYENTIFELTIFAASITLFFLYRHRVKYKKLIKARKELPLIVGGWGTRGKSGTERIKAAMFNALGYNIVSKTTGCEAMFLHSRGYSSLKEMFLFRPYDKATIWEQYDLVKLSSQMDTDIFLWECMALTPSYVNILQQEWMQDDISTITNTYPDHENLQGPSGRDIPEVMKNFIPSNRVLLTSEEEMTPLLKEDAENKNSHFKSIGWKEAGKIADDILKRFPYDEHPYNIALVNELGKYLEIDEDLALKSMADLVIPDIGVLKIFPIANYNNRYLEFINGMSANERFGTLSNWNRLNLYDFTLENNPDIFISTVINNRADRISRSRVFADIVTFDLNADIHFLIGTNLNSFIVYVKESFNANKDKLNLFKNEYPLKQLDILSDIYRLPKSKDIAQKRIDIINQNQDENNKDNKFVKNILEDLSFYNKIKDLIENNKEQKEIQTTFEDILLSRLIDRIIVIEDPNATGDEVIHIISENTPYNMTNKIMGLQNIKGTGLDFVYKFLNWEQCYINCQKIQSTKKVISLDGITQLSRFKEYGPLSFNYVKEVLNNISKTPFAQNEYYQAQIDNILSEIERLEKNKKYNNSNSNIQQNNKITKWIMETIESFLDAGDAVKRKKEVEQIYNDLINYRISHEKAAIELKKINKRQKGGWFLKK